jgi:hypothetical protein
MYVERVSEPASRWISVVFLQGKEAKQAFDRLDRGGPARAIEFMRRWDRGDETVDSALTNGYVYDRIPAGSTDITSQHRGSPYALTYSRAHRYISLLRRYYVDPDPELASAQTREYRKLAADPWFCWKGRPTIKAGRTVTL